MDMPSLLDDDTPDPWQKLTHMVRKGSGVELAELRHTNSVHVLPPPSPGQFYERQVQTFDGRVDCCPPSFAAALHRSHELFAETESSLGDGRLRLIHRRDAWMHNSWFANVKRMKRNGRTTNPVSLHPDDAARLGASDGHLVTVTSDHGQISTVVEIDDALMPGVVSMVHGWGHSASPGLRVAHRHPGANPNQLLPIGEGSFEPLSNQAHMTGIPVEIRLLA
jgi:formate dehydrogenase